MEKTLKVLPNCSTYLYICKDSAKHACKLFYLNTVIYKLALVLNCVYCTYAYTQVYAGVHSEQDFAPNLLINGRGDGKQENGV